MRQRRGSFRVVVLLILLAAAAPVWSQGVVPAGGHHVYLLGSWQSLISLWPLRSPSASLLSMAGSADPIAAGLRGFASNPANGAYVRAAEAELSLSHAPERYCGVERSYYFATQQELEDVRMTSRKDPEIEAVFVGLPVRRPGYRFGIVPVLGYWRYYSTGFDGVAKLEYRTNTDVLEAKNTAIATGLAAGLSSEVWPGVSVGFEAVFGLQSQYLLKMFLKQYQYTILQHSESKVYRYLSHPSTLYNFGITIGGLTGPRLGLQLCLPQRISLTDGLVRSGRDGWVEVVNADDIDVEFPLTYKLGVAVPLSPLSRVYASLHWLPWSGIKIDGEAPTLVLSIDDRHSLLSVPNDGFSYGVGFETGDRFQLRFGASRTRLPFEDMHSEPVSKWTLAAGVSVSLGLATFHMALQYDILEFDVISRRFESYKFKNWGPQLTFGITTYLSALSEVRSYPRPSMRSRRGVTIGGKSSLVKILVVKGGFLLADFPSGSQPRIGEKFALVRLGSPAAKQGEIIGLARVLRIRGNRVALAYELNTGYEAIDRSKDFLFVAPP